MRLIDADLLTEEIESLRCTLTGLWAGKGVLDRAADEYRKSILQIISDQPTAFDKEKVINEIHISSAGMAVNMNVSSSYAEGYIDAAKDIIEIVERGGIE